MNSKQECLVRAPVALHVDGAVGFAVGVAFGVTLALLPWAATGITGAAVLAGAALVERSCRRHAEQSRMGAPQSIVWRHHAGVAAAYVLGTIAGILGAAPQSHPFGITPHVDVRIVRVAAGVVALHTVILGLTLVIGQYRNRGSASAVA